MLSKLNSDKSPTNQIDRKETKFQKYLRERNEKLLEKCFNIKIEKTVLKNNELSPKLTETNNEQFSEQPNKREKSQQTCENILQKRSDGQETSTPEQQSLTKTVNDSEEILNSSEEIIEINSSVNKNIQSSKSASKVRSSSVQLCSNSKSFLRTTQIKRSTCSSNSSWESPFRTFTTKGPTTRLQRTQQSFEFSYDLSRDELQFAGPFGSPMRPTPQAERELLKSGQRREYLMQRYEHSPVFKYNYPEATSWRIGWLHQKL